VILMTAYATVPAAVDAIRQGAYDYLAKPFEPDEALLVVERALERRRLKQQAHDLRRALEGIHRIDELVARSPAMAPVVAMVKRAASSDSTVLITGESGTGKEVVARAIHNSGDRKHARFVAVNCGAIPENLLESELFGHVRGSFTGATADRRGLFEEADEGTLFLDEIADLPLAMQVKLNRVLQERKVRRIGGSDEHPVDVRVIAATNVDLRARVTAGQFREDLFYRINVLHIALPALRDRREDIPALAAYLLDRQAARRDSALEGFTEEALSALVKYPWPGNVRELENAIERAVVLTRAGHTLIDEDALPREIRDASPGTASATSLTFPIGMPLSEIEMRVIHETLRHTRGDKRLTAKLLGIATRTIYRRLEQSGEEPGPGDDAPDEDKE